MYIAAFEGLMGEGKAALAGQYHESLRPHLRQTPGFIEETQYASIDVPNKALLLSRWEDSASMSRWRNQSDHLRIQEKSSRDVFLEYKLRIGPAYEVGQDLSESGSQPRCFVVLYRRLKENGRAFGVEISEVKVEKFTRVKALMLDSSTYEDVASVLRLSVWRSQEDALLYEASVERVKGDSFERFCVERDYSKGRREDAAHHTPGQLA